MPTVGHLTGKTGTLARCTTRRASEPMGTVSMASLQALNRAIDGIGQVSGAAPGTACARSRTGPAKAPGRERQLDRAQGWLCSIAKNGVVNASTLHDHEHSSEPCVSSQTCRRTRPEATAQSAFELSNRVGHSTWARPVAAARVGLRLRSLVACAAEPARAMLRCGAQALTSDPFANSAKAVMALALYISDGPPPM